MVTSTLVSDPFTKEKLNELHAKNRPGIFWRHDVDFSPECAVEMAHVENLNQVRSTYYFNPRTDEYDIFSQENRKIVMMIVGCGHRIGTHVDLGHSRDALVTDQELHLACRQDWHMMWSAYPMTRDVSFHAPPRDVFGRSVEGFDSAHDPFWQPRYVGDSRGVYPPDLERRLESDELLQVNLHPEWWFLPEDEKEKLREQEAEKP